MSLRSFAVARLGTVLLLRDPAPMIVTIAMPLLLIGFLVPGARAQLHLAGYTSANGSELVVPGIAVMFSFLSTQLVGTLFFREHAWGTWDRLRVTGASTADLLVGKAIPLYVVQLAQLAVVLLAGRLFFGYRPTGSVLAIGAVVAVFVAALVAYGFMMVAVFDTMDLALVVGNLGGMVMAGLGGAFTPVATFPGWVQALAHATPAYWALDALGRISLDGADLGDVAGALGALAAFGVLFGAVTVWRFRPGRAKTGTT
jgi:ABC-2 type transport system permease protein